MFPAEINLQIRYPLILLSALIYIEVGRLLHLISLLSIGFSVYFLDRFIEADYGGNLSGIYLFGFLTIYFITIPFFAQLDAYSRFQNYKLMKDLLYHYGFKTRFIKVFRYSRCQREAVYCAARDMGYKSRISLYYKICGYRWYHILPDFVWSHPEYLFSKHFWSTTFFTKTYYPKYYID
jgi:hypothetical protein